jgi:ABC-2 type transport system ATP-binding protein
LTAISAKGLSKYYGPVKALDNLNLEIPENAVFGFLGPNGAGKTTTIKLLTGFANPTAGEAWVAGEKIGNNSLGVQAKIGLVPDVPAFYEWMTGRDLMHFVGELHSIPPAEIKKRTEELLELVEIKKHGNRRVGTYSRGMRQRLGIAQALINHPSVLFLDEPTSALDPIGRREVLNLILRLRENTTVFMSSHILSDVERVCNMVGIINKGKLETVDSVEGLQKKYARSVFEIEFMEDPFQFVESLKKITWLADAALVIDNGTPKVTVRAVDVERARKELPGIIAQSGLTMTRYELMLPSVEDIFVEIMTNGGKK